MAFTAYKIELNGMLLPDIYTTYDAASAAKERLKESTVAACVNIKTIDSDTGLPN